MNIYAGVNNMSFKSNIFDKKKYYSSLFYCFIEIQNICSFLLVKNPIYAKYGSEDMY